MTLSDISIQVRRLYEPVWRLYRLIRAKTIPEPRFKIRSFRFEVASACNARCSFCVYPLIASDRGSSVMSMDTFRHGLELAKHIKQRRIDFTPVVGDPLLDPEISEKLVEAHDAGFETEFTSNLIALSNHNLINSWKLDTLKVSIPQPDTESYKKMFGVDRLCKVKVNLLNAIACMTNTKIVVQVRNHEPPSKFDHLLDFIPRSNRVKVVFTSLWENWNNRVARPEDWTQYMVDGLYWNPIISRPCENLRSMVIHADGSISACNCRPVSSDLVVGHVQTSSIEQLEASAESIQQQFRAKTRPKSCTNCSFYCPC